MSELNPIEQSMLCGVILVAFVGLIYALWLWRDTVRRNKGTKAALFHTLRRPPTLEMTRYPMHGILAMDTQQPALMSAIYMWMTERSP